MPRMVL